MASRSWRAAAYQIGSAVSGVEPYPVCDLEDRSPRYRHLVAEDAAAVAPGPGEERGVPGRGLGGQRADRSAGGRTSRAQRGHPRHQPARHRVVDHLRPRAVQAQQDRPRLAADVRQSEPRVERGSSRLLPCRQPQRRRRGRGSAQARRARASLPSRTAASSRRRRSGRPPPCPRNRAARPPRGRKRAPRGSAGTTRGGRPGSSPPGSATGTAATGSTSGSICRRKRSMSSLSHRECSPFWPVSWPSWFRVACRGTWASAIRCPTDALRRSTRARSPARKAATRSR